MADNDSLDKSELIGLTVNEANTVARKYGYSVYITEDDGEGLGKHPDYDPRRINVAMNNGIITRLRGMG